MDKMSLYGTQPSRAVPVLATEILAPGAPPIPDYLEETYWWAYLHPRGVRFFERQWIVNLILWGNFAHLRDQALAEFGASLQGRTLQVACVYGDFTAQLASRLAPGAHLDVVDVAPVQLENLARKLGPASRVRAHRQDSTALGFADGLFDQVVVFFLLHEQPAAARLATVREAVRVLRPGGKLVFVDYHRPAPWHPLRFVMSPLLRLLEPFAMDLWQGEIAHWLPPHLVGDPGLRLHKQLYFGGLYQKVVVTCGAGA
ncbi:MAG: rhodoquinone biosynthesis methyltransferase RquA [Magnetococcus sp. WYHC-3]